MVVWSLDGLSWRCCDQPAVDQQGSELSLSLTNRTRPPPLLFFPRWWKFLYPWTAHNSGVSCHASVIAVMSGETSCTVVITSSSLLLREVIPGSRNFKVFVFSHWFRLSYFTFPCDHRNTLGNFAATSRATVVQPHTKVSVPSQWKSGTERGQANGR